MIVNPKNGDLNKPPSKFRNCLFKVCPVKKCLSTKKCEESKTEEQNLQNLEAEEEDLNNLYGKSVKYGSIVRLFHIKSEKYLCVNKYLASFLERDAMKVYLEKSGNDCSLFYIMPHYKLRSIGEDIHIGDEVLFKAATFNHKILHVCELDLIDKAGLKEVNVMDSNTSWKVKCA